MKVLVSIFALFAFLIGGCMLLTEDQDYIRQENKEYKLSQRTSEKQEYKLTTEQTEEIELVLDRGFFSPIPETKFVEIEEEMWEAFGRKIRQEYVINMGIYLTNKLGGQYWCEFKGKNTKKKLAKWSGISGYKEFD